MEIWVPLLQSLIWPIFIGMMLLIFRDWLRELLFTIKRRIESGSDMSIGPSGFALGLAPKLEETGNKAASPSQVERIIEGSKKSTPQKETLQELSEFFLLVHTAKYSPQLTKQHRQPYYKIQIWLETETPELLQKVSKVVYHLHPTFFEPEREITDRATNFEFSTSGWGEFTLSADIYFGANSQPLRLYRYINF